VGSGKKTLSESREEVNISQASSIPECPTLWDTEWQCNPSQPYNWTCAVTGSLDSILFAYNSFKLSHAPACTYKSMCVGVPKSLE
jgi:hypothetical protein